MRLGKSLRWKLTALIAGCSVLTALIAAAGFSWFDLKRFQQSTTAQVAAVANIVSDQAAPAMMLGDRKAAKDILNSLGTDPMVRSAVLYDFSAVCFAVFNRGKTATCPPMPPLGIRREGQSLLLSSAVTVDNDRLGTLAIVAAMPSVVEVLGQYLRGAALIFVLSLLVAGMVALALQTRVSKPILAVASVAQRMAKTHRFDERVTVSSSDELGVLADSFNTMIGEIERRDSELRLARDKAEEAARLKTEFLANMSHEIRTPMNGVTGMISLVLDKCSDTEQREQLLVAQQAAQSLITILNDILDLSKLEAGKMAIEAIDFDLRSVVQQSVRIFESTARSKTLELRAAFAEACPQWVQGDPIRLRQVLVNLVGNAVKFTAGGSVELSVCPVGQDRICFEVRDTGIGIASAKLQSIFEPFTQADGSHSRQYGGTGLGLAISRRLVHLMGGRLWAESEQGRGSRFFAELPLSARPAPAVPTTAVTEDLAASPVNLRVLVAEDNPTNQKVITLLLQREGWTVTLAVNGREAHERFLQTPFDLVLMDIQMPEVDGLAATRLIRQHEHRQAESGARGRTPIVALTAHASGAQHEQCLSEGMDAVITKPIDRTALIRCIRELAGRQSAAPA
jgi:signal transduction histidine kinase/ActR/RegA family two-component response regulator